MADKFLRDHKEGETVEGCFFLKGKRTRTAKNGKDYAFAGNCPRHNSKSS